MSNNSIVRIMLCAVLMLVGLASAGCERVNTSSQTAPAIPADTGELVAVTQGDGARQAILWFKQADQTIVAVRVWVPRGTTRYPRAGGESKP
jgi:microcompartment protein CcmK/EutM